MGKTKRVNLWLVLMMTLIAVLSCFFGVFALKDGKKTISASAATETDVTDTVSIVNSSYGENQSQFIIKLTPANTLTTNAWWNINGSSLITANNGVDIMNYIYINGQNLRTLSDDNRTSNTYPVDTASGWLANSDQCRPAFVESTGDGIYVTVLHAFSTTNYKITLKAGFSILNTSGTMSTVNEDVNFTYNAGTVSKEAKKTDVKDTVDITNSSYGENQSQFIIKLNPASTLTSNAWWNINGSSLITANNGVDIMNYIYINGQNIRTLSDNNRTSNTYPVDTASGWLANSDQCRPAFVESTGDGIYVTVLHAFSTTNYTITLKAGFDLVNADGGIYTISEDVSFAYSAGTVSKVHDYTLSFEGLSDTKTVTTGQAIGELPAVPEKSGYTGVWQIDGVEINASTVYNYGANKTATAVYTQETEKLDVTETIWFTQDDWMSGSPTDCITLSIRIYNETKTAWLYEYLVANSSIQGCWNDHASYATVNGNVDIMDYLYFNGESARSIVTNNTTYKGTTFPLSVGGVYSPIAIETTGSFTTLKILNTWIPQDGFTLTVKNGFELLLNDGNIITTTDEVSFKYANGSITKIEEYTLSFESAEGTVDPITVWSGDPLSNLPAVPEKSGYTGVWKIDGVEINANTVYNYGANKTAVAVYTKKLERIDVAKTVTIGVGAGELQSQLQIKLTPASTLTSNAWWNINGSTLIAANNGVDIMNYIYINGQNLRALSDDNRTNNTYPVGSATGWLTNSDQCRPAFVETTSDGIYVTVLHAFSTNTYTITLKAGFELLNAEGNIYTISEDVEFLYNNGTVSKIEEYTLSFEGLDDTLTVITGQALGILPDVPEVEGKLVIGWAIDGEKITEDTLWTYGEDKTATPVYADSYTLFFEGIDDTLTVWMGQPIGELPEVPAKDGCEGVWTIDDVEITIDTLYTYGADKTATAAYSKDIAKTFGLDNQPGYAGAATEVVFVAQTDPTLEGGGYLKSASSVSGVWNFGYADYQSANNGVDILEYICINGENVRSAVNKNNAGTTNYKGDAGWLGNGGACAPVFVEATAENGLVIRIYTGYSKNYFEITFKAGFRLIDTEDTVVYLSEDVTYKYINDNGTITFKKGTITDAELDALNGQDVTLMNGSTTHLKKSTCRLVLPTLDSVIVDDGLSQVFVGWTTAETFDASTSNLYSAGYVFEPDSATTLYAVWIGFEMQYGAAVRLTKDSSGIRFLTDVNAEDYKKYETLILGLGTFIVPTDYLETGLEFVHSSFAEGYYQDAPTKTWKVNGETDSTWTYTAAFTNLPEKQYSRKTSARGYLKIQYTNGEGYIYTPYSEEANARSIYQVATLAYDEYSSYEIIQNYVNKVADLTWDGNEFVRTEDAKGNYTVQNISADGSTFTVSVAGDFKSVLINGRRLVENNSTNVAIGDYIYKFSDFTIIDGGFTFTIGAADSFAVKESDETLYFYSSDDDLDFFLNDFFKRHSGYTEDGVNLKVNSVTAGVNSEEFFSHEWMSMAYYWYNSDDGYAEDRIAGLREFLSSVPVDDYGYVWQSNDDVLPDNATYDSTYHRMGWPIPHTGTLKTAHWDFNGSGDSGSWSSNVGASVSNGLYKATLSGQSSNVTFTSNSFTSSGIFSSTQNYTYRAPLLQMDIRIADASNVEDIYVWYTTNASKSFSEDKKVSVKDKAFISYPFSGEYNHLIFLPMYAESAWGSSESTYVRQIKVEIALKSGKTISGDVALNSVRLVADTRHSNNNSILISSLRQDYDFTGDLEFLQANITRARKAMNFLMQMYDSNRNLLKASYLVGHDGDKAGTWNPEKVAGSISNGYWDIMFMPEYDFQSNTYFYKALADMAYLEDVLESNGITVDASLATIKTATRSCAYGTSAYNYTASSLASTAESVVNAMRATTDNNGFWNGNTGRFAAGFGADGTLYDYGYAAWNLEAIYYGVASKEQANTILTWLSNEGGLYDYEFAPRSNTVSGKDSLNGQWYDANWSFGDNVQYGGATMYTSFYDLMARINYKGADNAFERLTAIQEWYMKVYNYYTTVANADPNEFYRYYYENQGIQLQGSGTEGGLGLDAEFLESYLPLSAVAYGFFGIDSVDGKTLQIAPELPTELTYWGMENLAFNFVEYDLKAYKNGVQITSVRGDTTGLKLQIVLDWEEGDRLYVNGVEVSADKVEDGKVYVTVAMGATIVEVR